MQPGALKTPRKTLPEQPNMAWPGGQKFLGKNYPKNFILAGMKIFRIFCLMWVGQKFSENFCPRAKFFVLAGQKILSHRAKFSEKF